ncbi:MAG: hypothetical protein GVY13_01845, partial [Alphaproteobacteria bacterium]|nr:hypothetical protein [Alphaproteobacteria bacterium]
AEQALGRYAAAAARYRACLAAPPDRPAARVNLGFCLQELADVDGALVQYRQALTADPTLYASVLKNLTTASHGRLPRDPRALRLMLCG